MINAARQPASIAFWTIAGLSAVWNAFGVYDYVMTNIRNPAYMAQFPTPVIDYIDEMPVWALGAWTLGVWAAVAGSLLLLRRSWLAVPAFALSLTGLAANTLREIIGGMPPKMSSGPVLAMPILVWTAALFFLWFSRRARRRGVLR